MRKKDASPLTSSPLKTLSDSIKAFLTDTISGQKQGPSIAKMFLNFYKQNLITPGKLDTLGVEGDKLTVAVEKRLDLFVQHAKGLEGYVAKVSVTRRRILLGEVTKENVDLVLREAALRRCFGGWVSEVISGNATFVEIPAIKEYADVGLLVLDIVNDLVQQESTLEGVLGLVRSLESFPEESLNASELLFLGRQEAPGADDGTLGKRNLESISSIKPEMISEMAKQRITSIIRLALKKTPAGEPAEYEKTLKCLTPKLFGMMSNPLSISEFVKKGIEIKDEGIQDVCLENLVYLISRHSFEFEGFYSMLYNLVKDRPTLEIKVLKILEISLKSRRLSAGVIRPFLKMMFRRCLFGELREVCWLLGLAINLLKS